MSKILSTIIIIAACLNLFACNTKSIIPSDETGLINGKTFNETLFVDGHKYDGLVIDNCIFENIDGDGIQIRNVNNLTIKNCTFRNIGNNAIRFRSTGSSDNVIIKNNLIHEIQRNGILVNETHTNTKIIGNTIYNVGLDIFSTLAGKPHHGIYSQGADVEISENIIYDIVNKNGNCISIRTHGKIAKNILYGATKHGISYYSDHPGNGELLLIENNFIYDNGKRGINLSSNGDVHNYIGEAIIRFNTIISSNKSPIGIDKELKGVMVTIDGNISIRTDGKLTFIYSGIPYEENNNITSNSDIGFIDFINRDLHIKSNSIAKNYAVGLSMYPERDFDNDKRESSSIDAGADEIN